MLPAVSRQSPRQTLALSPRQSLVSAKPSVGPDSDNGATRGLPPLAAAVQTNNATRGLPPLVAAVQTLRSKRRVQCRPPPRQLWRADVKRWMASCGKATEVELNKHDQQEAGAWFTALDMDGSGSVEEDEIRALMEALGVEATTRDLSRMFASIGKGLDAELTKPEFVRFMTLHGSFLTGQTAHAGRDLFDANTRLMMLSYRRKMLIEDWREPINRRNFANEEAFVKHYGPPLSGTIAVKHHNPPPLTPAPPLKSAASGAVGMGYHRSLSFQPEGAVFTKTHTLRRPPLPPPPELAAAADTSAEGMKAEGAVVAEETIVEEVATCAAPASDATPLVPEWG